MMKKYVRLNDGRIIDTKKSKIVLDEKDIWNEADNVIDLIKPNDLVVNRRGEFVKVDNGTFDHIPYLGIQELFTWDEKGQYRLVATFSGGKVKLM